MATAAWLSVKASCIFGLSTINDCKELKRIKTSKSTGLSNIPARLLKDGCNALAKPLAILMNRSFAEGAIPSDWKHAMVAPVFKVSSKKDPANYRPISVLPAFFKILERAVHTMVYHYLQENQLLTACQSGFRSLHSTRTCLIDTKKLLIHNNDKGLLTGTIFLVLSEAFDTLDHKMQEKLSLLGFNTSPVLWFNEYLTNRTQSVIINGVVSDPQSIPFGVPQGSILGPLLFIVYINQ